MKIHRYTEAKKDIAKEEFLKINAKRIKYLIDHIKIKPEWYDAGREGGHLRNYLIEYYNQHPITIEDDLNYNIDFSNDIFNTITHFEVIEHLMNALNNLKDCYYILKKGGKMYLTTPNDYSLIYKLEHLLSRKFADHFYQFNESELRWLLEEAGFKDIKISTFKRTNRGFIARWCKNSFFVEATK